MGITQFDEWVASATLRERSAMKSLQGANVAIEADNYLERLMSVSPTKEPLLSAIGGLPFALKNTVVNHVNVWKESGIQPFFVFSGIDGYKQDDLLEDAEANRATHISAWSMYEHQKPQDAVNTFGQSGAVKPKHIARYLQSILRELDIPFLVAPYSAWAQLAYLENGSHGAFQAIAGASECFLFDANKVIVEWDFAAKEFFWLRRKDLVQNLGNLPPDVFVDALLLSGSALLPSIPIANPQRKQYMPQAVRDLMALGPLRSGHQVCVQYEEDPQMRAKNYPDRFRKARTAVRNHSVATMEGKIEMINFGSAPGNMHEIMGQHLPDELYTYLTKGLVGPRLLNSRVYDQVLELPSLAGGDNPAYRALVSEKLTDVRQATYGLLSHSLHRAFQHRDVNLRCWFEADVPRPLRIQDFSERDNVGKFFVKASTFGDYTRPLTKNGLLGIVTLAANDSNFASQTVGARAQQKPLTLKDEILFNSLWRVLLLRGYVDSSHKLTPWGRVLHAAIAALDGRDVRMEESVFLAIELARLGLLNADNMFPNYTGVPYRGTDTDKRNTVLVSRIACLFQLGHESIGFTGPLSRGLLAYNGMIGAVRDALRDLTEASIATLLMNGDADRARNDFTDMGLDLPFLHHNDCGLGIAVVSYLDELASRPEKNEQSKKEVRNKGPNEWFPHGTDFQRDLDNAFKLWDAVYEGVRAAGDLFKDRKIWDEVDAWLTPMR